MLAAMLSSRVRMNRQGHARAGTVILALGFAAACAPTVTAADDEPVFTPAPCASYFGGGVTALACGSDAGKGAGIDLTHPDGTVESTRAVVADLGPGWVAQRVDVAPTIGDVVSLRDPTGTVQELRLRIRGSEGQPYAARIVVPPAAGPVAGVGLRLDDGGNGLAIAGVPVGWETTVRPGVSGEDDQFPYLSVDRRRNVGALWVGGARLRSVHLRAVMKRGRLRRVRLVAPRPVRRADGYERWALRLPRKTKAVVGSVRIHGQRPRTPVYLAANEEIFRPAMGRTGR